MAGRKRKLASCTTAKGRRIATESTKGGQLSLIIMAGPAVGQIHELAEPVLVLGRADDADVRIPDVALSRRHAMLKWDAQAHAYEICDLGSRNGTVVDGEPIEGSRLLKPGQTILLGTETLARYSHQSEPEARFAHLLHVAVMRDTTTHVYNRRYLDEQLAAEVSFVLRHRTNLSLLLLDIHNYRAIADIHGPDGTNGMLRTVAAVLEQNVRREDVVARFAPDRFAVLCRGLSEREAVILARRLRDAVGNKAFAVDDVAFHAEVRLGVASFADSRLQSADALVDAAAMAAQAAADEPAGSVVAHSSIANGASDERP